MKWYTCIDDYLNKVWINACHGRYLVNEAKLEWGNNCANEIKPKWWTISSQMICICRQLSALKMRLAIVEEYYRKHIDADGHIGKTFRETKLIHSKFVSGVCNCTVHAMWFIVRRAGLLWSQQDFEWRWSVPLFKCLTVLEFSFILFDLCLLITFFNFIMKYVPIVTFWIFTYHKIWILSIMFCFIWSYWIIYFLACLEVSWRVMS